MGKRCIDLSDSETEYVTPPKAPRRLKLAHSVPKEAMKAARKGNPQDASSPQKSSDMSSTSPCSTADSTSMPQVLGNTPSRMDDIREEQERRFRLAVCQSTGAMLHTVLHSGDVDLQRAEIYACHAVQVYFMYNSFRHANFEVATLTAASKALKDSGSALGVNALIQELREEQQNGHAEAEGLEACVHKEMALLEQHLESKDGNTRCIDLISMVDDTMDRLVQALSMKDLATRQALKETARSFAVDAMLGPVALLFRPKTVAAVVVALGARWILPDWKDEIQRQIHLMLEDENPELQQEIRHTMREVTGTLRLLKAAS